MEKNVVRIAYRNAFRCEQCPGRADEEGCPAWWSFIETDAASGKERLTEMCGLQAAPIFLVHALAAANRPAAAIESTREVLTSGLAIVAQAVAVQRAHALAAARTALSDGSQEGT